MQNINLTVSLSPAILKSIEDTVYLSPLGGYYESMSLNVCLKISCLCNIRKARQRSLVKPTRNNISNDKLGFQGVLVKSEHSSWEHLTTAQDVSFEKYDYSSLHLTGLA